MTRNEAAAQVVQRYRRHVDQLEDLTARFLASRYAALQRQITADLKTLNRPDPLGLPLTFRYQTEVEPIIRHRIELYAIEAEKRMTVLAENTARLGAETADRSARKVVDKSERNWERVQTAGLLSGPLFNASKDALRRIPTAITEKLGSLISQAAGMAEKGLDWLMSQIGEVFGNIWSGLQRTIRTLAEQMFRRAQREQARQTPVTKWIRVANHETACLACLMLEGTIYDREEDFGDHPNGRCTIVPIEAGTETDDRPGKRWLEEQDEDTQRRILGKSRFEAWKNGDISLDDLTETVRDPVYGPIPHVIPLSRLGLTP